MSTPTVRRTVPRSTTSTRPPSSATANSSSIDVDDLADQMLASLGIARQENKRTRVSGVGGSSNSNTTTTTSLRQTRSSKESRDGSLHSRYNTSSLTPGSSIAVDENVATHYSSSNTTASRAVDRTPVKNNIARPATSQGEGTGSATMTTSDRLRKSSNGSTGSRLLTPHGPSAASTPLTAIRRPSQPVHLPVPSTSTTTNAALRASTSARKASNPPLTLSSKASSSPSAARSPSASASAKRRTSSATHLQSTKSRADHAGNGPVDTATSSPKGLTVTEEEYSALISLLAIKDEEIARLKDDIQKRDGEVRRLEERCASLETQQQQRPGNPSSPHLTQLLSPTTNGSAGKKHSPAPSGAAGITKKEYDDITKQFEMQENLLLGFQRENEKATAEIDVLKKRERQLTEHLKKIYGPSFSADAELSPLNSDHLVGRIQGGAQFGSAAIPSPSSAQLLHQHRRRSGHLLQLQETSPVPEGSSSAARCEVPQPSTTSAGAPSASPTPQFDTEGLMEQLLAVQALVQRFERRLLSRESELLKKEDEAKSEVKQARLMLEELRVS